MRVVCLNWCNYLGRGELYVARLRSMVERHLTIPHEFVVVTERDLGTEAQGWWNKLAILRYADPDTMLYLDLDLVITANIDHLVELARTDRSKLWMRDDFSYSIVDPRIDPRDSMVATLGGVGCCNSSVMLWHEPIAIDSPRGELHGDQNLISKALWPHGIGLLPNESVKSYKYHWRMGHGFGPITVFHGDPKNHEVDDQWVRENWQ